MKLNCNQSLLQTGLGIVGRAVSNTSTLPILGNVLLATDDGRIKLQATDLEIGITHWLNADVQEDGATTMPSRTLIDFVNVLSDERVYFGLNEKTQTLSVEGGRSKANIKGINANEFPEINNFSETDCIQIGSSMLCQVVGRVSIAAAPDQSRPILAGILMQFRENKLTMAAADGFRLSVCTIETPTSIQADLIVPARSLVELRRIAGKFDGNIEIINTDTKIAFRLPDTEIVSQLIAGNFPDYNQIIPTEYTTRAVLDTTSFQRACKAALIFARDAAHIVRLHIKPDENKMVVSATSAETGSDVIELDVDARGDEIEIAFNVQYLIDVLNVVGTEMVALEMTTSSQPGVLRAVGDDGFVHVLMPMHLGK